MSENKANSQSGFAAIAAIFLVVILAALGGFMLTFSNTQQLTSGQDLQGSRAYWAARAGLEWGIGSVAPQPSATASCPTPATTQLTVGAFTVCVTCVQNIYTEGPATMSVFQFTSSARTPLVTACADTGAVGAIGYFERSLSASMEKNDAN
jgi:MSHA biogenesis protein MshP